MYFNNFPIITYDLSGNTTFIPKYVTNIFVRMKIRESIKNNVLLYYPYYIKEGETPEMIAHKYYRDINKHWLVMMVNDINNIYTDWPKSNDVFLKYLIDVYGSLELAQTTIHSYWLTNTLTNQAGDVTITTNQIDLDTYNSTPSQSLETYNFPDGTSIREEITTSIKYAYDYESELNESKRQIKLLDKNYAQQIQDELDQLYKNG